MAATTATAPLTARTVPDATSGRAPVVLRRAPRVARLLTQVVMAALAAALIFLGVAVAAEPAQAGVVSGVTCPFGNEDTAAKESTSEMFRSGVDSVLPAIDPVGGQLMQTSPAFKDSGWDGKPVTAYEYYGTSGAFWSQYRSDDECWGSGAISVMGNMMANQMFTGTKAITTMSIGMYQWASSPDLLADFTKPMDEVVKGLKTNLYLNFLSPIIVLGALWMGWQGLVKKRTTEATQGAIWMIGSAVFALVFMAWPSWVATQANSVISTVNSTAMTAVTGATSNAISKADICYLPQTAPKAGVRMASCSIYKALVYTPWGAGQFGVSSTQALNDGRNDPVTIPGHTASKDLRLSQLEAQATSAGEAQRVAQQEGQVASAAERKKVKDADVKRWENIQKRAETEEWGSVWSGSNVGARMNIGFASMVASIAAGSLVLVISFASIVLALGMIMLIMLAPLFLLVGAHPGFGRGIALKWLELLLGTMLKRIVLGFLLAVLIGFYQVILATSMAWFSQVAMIIAVGVGALMYRKPLLETMNIINLGGSRTGLENNVFDRHAKKAGAGAIGMVGGAAAGGRDGMLNGGKKAALTAALGGAASGAMMGARSGNPLRAAQMGAGAGRRTASRQEGARDKRDRNDDPFVYDRNEKAEAKQAANLQRIADEYADDPEMQRRLQAWATKNDRPVPRPGGGAAPEPDPNPVESLVDAWAPAPAPGAGRRPPTPPPTSATPRPASPAAPAPTGGAAPAGPAPAPAPSVPAPMPVPHPSAPQVADAVEDLTREVKEARTDLSSVQRAQGSQGRSIDDLGISVDRAANGQDAAAQALARVKQMQERQGHRPGGSGTPPSAPPAGGSR